MTPINPIRSEMFDIKDAQEHLGENVHPVVRNDVYWFVFSETNDSVRVEVLIPVYDGLQIII